jgi:GxxExxY protein
MKNLIYKSESYAIIGACMEVHRHLGCGFLEVLYKDALEIEFKIRNIPYVREQSYEVTYKGVMLRHKYIADFVVYDKIILEAKCASKVSDLFRAVAINYLKASKNKLALLVNFGELSLTFDRLLY